MSLLGTTVRHLKDREVESCLIGAAAMAALGVSRATQDADLFTTDPRVLDEAFWRSLKGLEIEIRHGDDEDPLRGVVRLHQDDSHAVDLIVGRSGWQREISRRGEQIELDGETMLVARPVDLVCLKLYAGGPQDLWDVQQLLEAVADRDQVVRRVNEQVRALPRDARQAWDRISDSLVE